MAPIGVGTVDEASTGPVARVLQRVREGAQAAPRDPAAVETRRSALCTLLRRQRIPYSELADGVLHVLSCLRVAAPYTPGSTVCENEIVLGRFLRLLAALDAPHDAEDALGRQAQ